MNKLLLAAAALLVAAPVLAQTMPTGQPERRGQGMGQGMGMKDKVQTRAEVIARTQRAFAMLDTNHDGVLDQAELAAAGRNWDGAAGRSPNSNAGVNAARPMPMDRNAMFDMFDTNPDGNISRDEFARAPMNHGMGDGKMGGGDHGGMGGMDGGGMARMWSMADANHDGRVTLKEATDMALMRFDRMDANHDGQVTPEERGAARALRGK